MKLTRPSQAELDKMSHQEKDALILMLFDLLEQMEKRLQIMEQRVEKDSHNSSKPPSSDGLKKAPAQPRQPGQKPAGGQKGHNGTSLKMTDQPDRIEYCRPQGLCACGEKLETLPTQLIERRQQIEIPKPRVFITEYQKLAVQCRCGQQHEGIFPDGISPHVSYGPRLKAYALGLAHGHFVGLERVTEIINDQYGVKPSVGSLQKWTEQCAERLQPNYQTQHQNLVAAKVGHFDESGLRVAGKLQWLHVAATEQNVYYSCQPP